MRDVAEFVKDRDEAFTRFIMNDDLSAVTDYMNKYGIKMPSSESILRAGVYKAAQEITDMPQEIKDVARAKCMMLGFKPTMF